jgi:hypothetical protein
MLCTCNANIMPCTITVLVLSFYPCFTFFRSDTDKCQSIDIAERRDAKSHFSNHNIGVLRELCGGQLLLDLCLALPNLSHICALHGLTLDEHHQVTLNTVSKMAVSEAPKLNSSR